MKLNRITQLLWAKSYGEDVVDGVQTELDPSEEELENWLNSLEEGLEVETPSEPDEEQSEESQGTDSDDESETGDEASSAEDGDDPETEEEAAVEEPSVEPEVPEVQEQPEPEPEFTAEQMQERVNAWKGELEKQFAISDEDADLLASDPQKVFPKLAANLYMAAMQGVSQMLQQQLPRQVEQVQTQVVQRNKALEMFQSRWSDLVKPENEAYTVTALKTVKQQYPNASLEEVIEKAGVVAYALKGQPVPGAPVAKPKPKATVHKPAKPSSAVSTPVVKPKLDEQTDWFANS